MRLYITLSLISLSFGRGDTGQRRPFAELSWLQFAFWAKQNPIQGWRSAGDCQWSVPE
jgi:hypothetical protein